MASDEEIIAEGVAKEYGSAPAAWDVEWISPDVIAQHVLSTLREHGRVIVPREATWDMLDVGEAVAMEAGVQMAWRAMIDAAEKDPTP